MKSITSRVTRALAAALIAAGALAAHLQAQSEIGITVQVPFPFSVGKHTIQAGTYQFWQINQFQLSVLNVKTGEHELFPIRPERQRAVAERGFLILQNGDACKTLKEVHLPGSNIYSELTMEGCGTDVKSEQAMNTITLPAEGR